MFFVKTINAQHVTNELSSNNFILFDKAQSTNLLYDKADETSVITTVNLFVNDIKNVSGKAPMKIDNLKNIPSNILIVGSLRNNKWIKELIKKNLIDTVGMTNAWERYSYQLIENPWHKGGKAFVILGSDRRGTSYGMLEISKEIGVSPWYWWADVPIKQHKRIILKGEKFISHIPDVKYRGIFINDEDWGMLPWSKKNFEKKLGDIGPKTYAKVCELLLRLKANYLWPAMHPCTGAFNTHPQNKVVADNYGIVMGASHCEPLLYNNASEWNSKTMGQWDYETNRKNIDKVLDKRVSENGKYENVYPIGIRGIHDHPMEGNYTIKKKIKLVEQAISDERTILEKNCGKPSSQIPQIFVPYAEVLPLYNNGLKIPDDVTIMWVDDNYGYMRRLSNPLEQERSGGSGVYYHLAYLGNPHSYTWINTVNPALVCQEMHKSYDYGARRVWIANVGDLKPSEYNINVFLDMAWDINSVNRKNLFTYQEQWFENCFGKEVGKYCSDLMNDYYQVNFKRKPEFMGWGQEYGYFKWKERVQDTEFSFLDYNEVQDRISKLSRMNAKVDSIRKFIDKKHIASFIELVSYPIKGTYYMNKKLLLAQKNRWYARIGNSMANKIIPEIKAYHDSVRIITEEYENMLNAKWKYMICEIQSSSARFAELPPYSKIKLPKKPKLGLIVEENNMVNGVNTQYSLPEFNVNYPEKSYYIKVYNKGSEVLNWRAKTKSDWIKLTCKRGKTLHEEKIYVNVDWSKVKQEEVSATIEFYGAGERKTVIVKALNKKINLDKKSGAYIENNGYISIPLENYQRKIETKDVKWMVQPGLGITGASLTTNDNAKTIGHWAPNDKCAHVEYDFYTFNSGRFYIYTYTLPTFPITSFMQQRYAVVVDDGERAYLNAGNEIDTDEWRNNVRRNSAIKISSHYIEKPGWHTLKIFFMDPGVVLDKAVIDFGGLKKSYLGPKATIIKKD